MSKNCDCGGWKKEFEAIKIILWLFFNRMNFVNSYENDEKIFLSLEMMI